MHFSKIKTTTITVTKSKSNSEYSPCQKVIPVIPQHRFRLDKKQISPFL